MTDKEILIKARELIADPEHWTQLASARDGDGRVVGWFEPSADSFCLAGAMDRAVGFPAYRTSAFASLQNIAVRHRGRGVVEFNDHPETAHADVLAVLDEAIENAV